MERVRNNQNITQPQLNPIVKNNLQSAIFHFSEFHQSMLKTADDLYDRADELYVKANDLKTYLEVLEYSLPDVGEYVRETRGAI